MRRQRIVGRIYGMKYSWKGHKDRKSNRARQKNRREDSKVESNDSPEIPDRGGDIRYWWSRICVQVSVGKFVLDTAEAGLACMCVRSNHLYRKLMEQYMCHHNGFNLLLFFVLFWTRHQIQTSWTDFVCTVNESRGCSAGRVRYYRSIVCLCAYIWWPNINEGNSVCLFALGIPEGM